MGKINKFCARNGGAIAWKRNAEHADLQHLGEIEERL
jgi:hypothetical protein